MLIICSNAKISPINFAAEVERKSNRNFAICRTVVKLNACGILSRYLTRLSRGLPLFSPNSATYYRDSPSTQTGRIYCSACQCEDQRRQQNTNTSATCRLSIATQEVDWKQRFASNDRVASRGLHYHASTRNLPMIAGKHSPKVWGDLAGISGFV